MADSKLAQVLSEKKIDKRRLLAVSKRLERLRVEDRALRLAKRRKSGSEEEQKAAASAKPRSGRPVSPSSLELALAGKPVVGPVKTRILRAVNHVLETRKQDAIDMRALF